MKGHRDPGRDRTRENRELLDTVGDGQEQEFARQTTGKALQNNEARLEALLNASTDAACLLDPSGRLLAMNQQLARRMGGSVQELLGMSVFAFLPQALAQRRQERLRKVVTTRNPLQEEDENRGILFLESLQPVLAADGTVEAVAVFVRDISEQKRTGKELLRAKQGLEKRVLERTAELSRANEQLRREVAQRTKAERALQRRADLARLVSRISRYFANLAPLEIDKGIGYAVEAIGEFVKVDRIHVFLYSNGGTRLDNTHEWCSEGVEPQIQYLQALDPANAPWFGGKVRNQESVHIPRVAALPPEASKDKRIFDELGIKSLVVVPIASGNKIRGFMGLDSIVTEREWPDDVIELLRIAADLLWNALERKETEERLLASEQLYRSVVETQTELICRFLPDGTLTFVNDAYCRYFDKSRGELLGQKFPTLVVPSDRDTVAEFLNSFSRTNPLATHEHRVIGPDGTVRWNRWTNSAIFDQKGEVAEFQAVVWDVTENKRAQEALAIKDSALASSINGIAIADLDGHLTYANASFLDLWGYTDDEVLGIRGLEFWLEAEKAVQVHEGLKEKGWWIGELKAKKRDGSRFDVQLSATTITDEQGKPICMLASFVDVTARKRVESALRESEERYRTLVERMNEGFIFLNSDATIGYVNDKLAAIMGFPRQEIVGRAARDFFDEENRAIMKEQFAKRSGGEASATYEISVTRKDGQKVPVLVSAKGLFDADGRLKGSLAVVTDITERKRADEQIKASLNEKEFLLREIHHRVKNNLQVMSSLFRLQSRYANNPELKEIFQEADDRIRSMAIVHDKLYRSKTLSHLKVEDYLHSLLDHLQSCHDARGRRITFKTQMEDVSFGVDTAIPLGFIITELITNCLKHAFPNGGAGEVRISLSRCGNDEFLLAVRDNGVGMPKDVDLQQPGSLGLRLASIFTAQLDGRIEFSSEEGTEFRIVFKEKHRQ